VGPHTGLHCAKHQDSLCNRLQKSPKKLQTHAKLRNFGQGENVLLELECIERMDLNLYVPQLASAPGVAAYFRGYKGHRFASTKEAVAMSEGFRRQVLDFAERKATPIIGF
jgi:hypothetical protein